MEWSEKEWNEVGRSGFFLQEWEGLELRGNECGMGWKKDRIINIKV